MELVVLSLGFIMSCVAVVAISYGRKVRGDLRLDRLSDAFGKDVYPRRPLNGIEKRAMGYLRQIFISRIMDAWRTEKLKACLGLEGWSLADRFAWADTHHEADDVTELAQAILTPRELDLYARLVDSGFAHGAHERIARELKIAPGTLCQQWRRIRNRLRREWNQ